MSEHQRFHLKTLDDLRAQIQELDLDMPVSEDLSVLSDPVKLSDGVIPNRFVVQPMEGFDAHYDGKPGDLAFRRYERYARGGFGMIWLEATAVMHEARSNPHQFYLHEGSVDEYKRLVDAMREAAQAEHGRDLQIVMQLTHSGRYSKPDGKPEPIIAHRSPILDPRHNLPEDYPLVTDEYLDRLKETYVNAAKLAARAGCDGIDIKACHRYLVAELHASFTREGKYGGSFENRTRLLRETLSAVKQEVPEVFICTRMNAFDAISYPYGFGVDKDDYRVPDLTEPLQLAGELKRIGIPVLNISIGNPYYNPHFGRPFDFPSSGVEVPGEHPLLGLSRFVGVTTKFQQTYPDLPVVGSGYSWLRHLLPYVGAGLVKDGRATLIGLGRGAFAYPDTPRDVMTSGKMDPSQCCVTCSACTQIMRDGGMTGCVVRDSEIYGPQYRKGRKFAIDRLKGEASRCRECENATCTVGCPAHVDVPAFIKAFADDDIKGSYDILRDANVLPEMCAYVCPSEVQCEGGCVEGIFCQDPIPIRDIQMAVCRLARGADSVGLRLPAESTGKKIAIMGGGPAGIATAVKLLEKGHSVTICDRSEKLGGTPDSIIPSERYMEAETEVEAVLKPAVEAGRVELKLGCEVGADTNLQELTSSHDAVLIAVGLGRTTSLGEADGVMDALDFLKDAKSGALPQLPSKVAVLGGGNTAVDAAVVANELGAADVYLIYRRSFGEMPAWPAEVERFLESGGHALILTQPIGYEHDAEGKLSGLRIARTELGAPDDSGRRKPSVVEDTESVLEVGLVVEALGQGVSDSVKEALSDIEFTERGLIKLAEGSFATSLDKVFAAGDLVNGGTTAVQCISEGMKAADEIDAFVMG